VIVCSLWFLIGFSTTLRLSPTVTFPSSSQCISQSSRVASITCGVPSVPLGVVSASVRLMKLYLYPINLSPVIISCYPLYPQGRPPFDSFHIKVTAKEFPFANGHSAQPITRRLVVVRRRRCSVRRRAQRDEQRRTYRGCGALLRACVRAGARSQAAAAAVFGEQQTDAHASVLWRGWLFACSLLC
jgi:hypothetical protein